LFNFNNEEKIMVMYNFNAFQIPHTGLSFDGALGDQQTRRADARMSNFGALSYGIREASDYTKLVEGFKSKDELQNPSVPTFLPTGNGGNWGNAINNPYVVGSTTHKMRTDEFSVMTLGSRNTKSASQPDFDVMGTDLVWMTVSGTTSSGVPLNFPTEGWNTFGGRVAGPFDYRVSK
jgi:hypothetical protein